MTVRVLFVSPVLTASARRGVFGDGDPLDDAGRAQARAAAGALTRADRVVTSPGERCRATAEALGLTGGAALPELAGLDAGRWRGRELAEVSVAEPAALAGWLADPEVPAPGGESVAEVCARVARWLDGVAAESGRVVAVVEPDVVRAAGVHATGAPPSAFWRLDVEPLTVTELSGRAGRWNVRLGRPLGPA